MRRIQAIQLGWFAVFAALAASAAGCKTLSPFDQAFNGGMSAYRARSYPKAAEQFKLAVERDGASSKARFYLAMSYLNQMAPVKQGDFMQEGANNLLAEMAVTEFSTMLSNADQPSDDPALRRSATQNLALILLRQGKKEESKEWFKKAIILDPRNKEAYENVAEIDEFLVLNALTKAQIEAGASVYDNWPFKNAAFRESLRQKYLSTIEEGMESAKQALQLDGADDKLMANVIILLREKAKLENSAAASGEDIKLAEEWNQKALAAERKSPK